MDAIIWTLLIVNVYAVLLYNRTSLRMHTGASFVFLVVIIKWYDVNTYVFVLATVMLSLVAIFFNATALRRTFVSSRILAVFRKNMPTISSTEEAALEAGTVWWDGELFSGSPDWNKLLALPAPKLSDREKAFLDGPVNELCRMLDDWHITQELQDLPEDVWSFIKKKRFFGMIIPEKYGGLEFTAQAHSAVVMKIASRSLSAAVTVMVPNSLGPAELLMRYGTEEQKERYLPGLASGEEVPCFALTGPEAGSDAASMPDNGIICKQEFNGKKDVPGIRLNWEKRYITLGPVSTVLGLAFRLYDPDHLLGDREDIGITLALIPTSTPGITIGNRHFPLDSAFQVGPNWGKDVFIPLDWIIGGKERAGYGWHMLMDCLAEGRSVSLPAVSSASSKLATRFISAYARIRKQFNLPIGRFEGVEEALARIAGYTYLADSARMLTASGVDQGEEPAVISAVVKYHLTELARNILTRNMIIFGQGVIVGHPYLLQEIKAAENKDRETGLREFDRAFFGHAGFVLSNIVRTALLAVTGSRIAKSAGSPYSGMYFRQLTRMSSAFALTADITLIMLGSALKRKERLSARLADALSYMYLAAAVLKRFEDDGAQDADLPLLHWSCRFSLYKVQESLLGLYENYPNRIVGYILRRIVFPYSKPFKQPSDLLDSRVAATVLSPSDTRDRLTDGIFIPDNTDEPLGRIEDAMSRAIDAERLEKKIQKAVKSDAVRRGFMEDELEDALKIGVINNEEAGIIRAEMKIRKEVVRVDDFPKDKWRRNETTDVRRTLIANINYEREKT
jgi:acyl-CoA dehydrogenase